MTSFILIIFLGQKSSTIGAAGAGLPFLVPISAAFELLVSASTRFLAYQFQPWEPPRRAGQMHGISFHDELTGSDVEALPDDELVLPSARGDQDLDATLPQRGVCIME